MSEKPHTVKIVVPTVLVTALITGSAAVGLRQSEVPDFELRIQQARLEGRVDAVESKISEDRIRSAENRGRVEALERMIIEIRARQSELASEVDEFKQWRNMKDSGGNHE
jgi:hypothetical protein